MDLVIRPALATDYKGILALDNRSYYKLDYIPLIYNDFIKDQDSNCFVALLGEKLVAFYNLHLLNATATSASSIAIRVHQDYQHQGIATALKTHVWNKVRGQHPGLTTRVSAVIASDYFERLCADPKSPETPIKRYMTSGLTTTLKSMSESLQKYTNSHGTADNIRALCRDNADDILLLTSCSAIKHLFPDKYFLGSHNWHPYECTRKNIEKMISSHKVFYMADPKEGNTSVLSLSFGAHMNTENGIRYILYYQSRADQINNGHLCAHVQRHLQNMIDLTNEVNSGTDLLCCVLVPKELYVEEEFDSMINMFGSATQTDWRAEAMVIEEKVE